MQQKFKIGDKVKVLTKAYPGAYGTEGVITKFGHGSVYMVDRNATNYPSDQYGTFDHDSWRYCFYESELELVEDKPEPKFKVGNKVRCISGIGLIKAGDVFTVTGVYGDIIRFENQKLNQKFGFDYRFELVTDQEVSNTEPDYVIGQEVYVSNDFNRHLRKGVLLDASPRNGLMHVNIGGFDCYVEEERVYTKELKGE